MNLADHLFCVIVAFYDQNAVFIFRFFAHPLFGHDRTIHVSRHVSGNRDFRLWSSFWQFEGTGKVGAFNKSNGNWQLEFSKDTHDVLRYSQSSLYRPLSRTDEFGFLSP